ncbi:MAG TPA: DUF4129 domain-containing protein [Terracidiphilus sp.]|jgi:hypothetical protein
MNLGSPGWQAAARSASVLALSVAVILSAGAKAIPSNAGWRDETVAEYQQRLRDLDAMVAACQSQRSSAAAAQTNFPACDPVQVGPDDRVHGFSSAPSQVREVRYDWLRYALTRAATKNAAPQKTIFGAIAKSDTKPVSVEALLTEARQRLHDDAAQAGAPIEAALNFSAERKSLQSILSQRAYQGVTQVSTMDRFREWFDNLLDKFFSGLVSFGEHAPWIVWLVRILVVMAALTALIWFILRIERRSRYRIVPEIQLETGAPSAREWQLWLRDAQTMATQGQWREAIHFLYWAAIARLEQKRLWPADRARTPREYLALIAGSDPRKTNLSALTRSFERTWYGGREAQAADFNAALEQAAALGVTRE